MALSHFCSYCGRKLQQNKSYNRRLRLLSLSRYSDYSYKSRTIFWELFQLISQIQPYTFRIITPTMCGAKILSFFNKETKYNVRGTCSDTNVWWHDIIRPCLCGSRVHSGVSGLVRLWFSWRGVLFRSCSPVIGIWDTGHVMIPLCLVGICTSDSAYFFFFCRGI